MHHDAVQIPWQPVKTRRASEEIYLQLREFILSGQLKPGDRLPSERAMMAQLNRSRPTIREALRMLEQGGYIASTHGAPGAVVQEPSLHGVEEPLAEMVEMLQQRGFACALELGSEDVLLTVRAQYIRRILDNIGSNLIKYADPARPIEVRFLRQEGRAGLVLRNHVLPAPPAVESTKVGLTSIETMMDKMHADCKIEQENEQFTMTLLFPVE